MRRNLEKSRTNEVIAHFCLKTVLWARFSKTVLNEKDIISQIPLKSFVVVGNTRITERTSTTYDLIQIIYFNLGFLW